MPPISSVGGAPGQLLRHGFINPPLHPGQIGSLQHYQLISILGEGGMGTVFKALDSRDGKTVAIKILRPDLAALPNQVHRFLKEARHMQRLKHPHILSVIEVSGDPNAPYFAMPLMERGSLSSHLSADHPLGEAECVGLARQVAEALAHAHAKGVIHRDLKPGNILLDSSGDAFLADFGLARTVFNDSLVDAGQGDQGEGTVHYMSPQLARGEAEDTRCDIYALGAVLYEMLAGRPPYEGPHAAQILEQIRNAPPEPLAKLRPDLSRGLTALIEGAMAREHRDRYANMADVLEDLERIENGQDPVSPHASLSLRRMATRRSRLLAGIGGILVLLAAAWGYQRLNRGDALDVIREFAPPDGQSWKSALFGAWDGDGEPDVVELSEGKLQAFSSSGHASHPIELGKPDAALPYLSLLADITGDGLEEAFIAWNRGTQACVTAFNQSGWPVKEFSFAGSMNVHNGVDTNYTTLSPAVVTDLEGNGRKELLARVVSTWALRPRGLACYDVETSQLKWFFETADFVTDVVTCDLDGDGHPEIIAGGNSPANGCRLPDGTDDNRAYVYAISSNGRLLWRQELAGVYSTAAPIKRKSADGTVFVWVRASHAYSVQRGEPDTGKVIKLDARGAVLGQRDFGVEVTSGLAADLDLDGEEEILVADRLGNLHVLDRNLQERKTGQVAKPRFNEIRVQLSHVIRGAPGRKPGIVLIAAQIEHRSAPQTGDRRDRVENVVWHDNQVVVVDSDLNPIASHLVAKKQSSLLPLDIKVEPLPRGPNEFPDLLVLGESAQVLRLRRHGWQ